MKRGRPVGSKDITPQKRRTQEKLGTLEETIKMTDQFKIDKSIAPEETHIKQEAPEEAHIEQEAPEEALVPENCDISISYVYTGEKWDQNNIIFTFQVTSIRNGERSWKNKFCLGLQIEHSHGVLVHQSTYIKKVLKRFYMDKVHLLSSPMIV